MASKVTLEISTIERQNGCPTQRLTIRFSPASLSDKALKYFWMKTGYAKFGTFYFDGVDNDA